MSYPPEYQGQYGAPRNQRQVDFGEAIQMGFNKYAQFGGRSSRSEYWWWSLFVGVIALGLEYIPVLQYNIGDGQSLSLLSSLWSLAIFIPNLAVTFRRLHDIGKGGGYILIGLIPLVGWIILVVLLCKPSETGDNRFGPEPNME